MEVKQRKERIMKHFVAFVALCLLILTALSIPNVFAQNQSNVEKVTQSNTQFALDIYKIIKTTEGNIFFSPYSISTAFAMTYSGARG